MQTLGNTTAVKSLASTIHKRLIGPTEEQYQLLDGKINNLLDDSRDLQSGLQNQIDNLNTSSSSTKEELKSLLTLSKNTRLLALIAIVMTTINLILFMMKF